VRADRPMSWGWLSARGLILQHAWLGVLTYVVPPGLVDEAVGDGLAWEMRLRLLPARVTAYFTLGLCLFSGTSYPGVFAQVTSGLGLASPATTALSAARRRLGEKPLESLFRRLCAPLSPGTEPWSHVNGLLAVAWDGTTLDAADSPANTAALGKPAGGKGRPAGGKGRPAAAFPQLRLVTLVACGTRALLDAAFGPARGAGTGERDLARQLLGSLRRGMLLLADRGFYSYSLWAAAAGTGADLLWRARADQHLPVARELPDGSWLTHVNDPRAVAARHSKNGKRRRRGSSLPPDDGPLPGFTARVIAFTVTVTADDGTARTERYRLLTTLLDHRAHPAAGLAAAYARRWAIETSYREWKTFLRGPGRTLRGKTPDLARQELWAYLVVYQAIRTLIARAAAATGTDPARLSFTTALHAARRTLPAARDHLAAALAQAEAEILASPVPERKGRVYPRAVKKPAPRYPSRNGKTSPISQHAQCTLTPATPGTTTPPPPDQPTHPSQQADNPP
jgi:Insertion element 4 transposase N-terminal/Transposase DDE domain